MSAAGAVKLAAAAAAGAGAAYLLDPDRGHSRRARLKDQTRSKLRKEARAVERQAHLQRGRVQGLVHRTTHHVQSPPENDHVLVDKVRSEVFGRRHEVASHVSVDAANGVVTLRGELDDPAAITELELAVRKVGGVKDVVNLLHRPGQPAANKADSLRA